MALTIKWKRGMFPKLMNSPAVHADLVARAGRIADAANRGAEGSEHVARTEKGKERARAAVITGNYRAIKAEAESANLTRAIDAGR